MKQMNIFNENDDEIEIQIEPTGESYFVQSKHALLIVFDSPPELIELSDQKVGVRQIYFTNGIVNDQKTRIASYDSFMKIDSPLS